MGSGVAMAFTEYEARADAQVRALLGRILALKRSAGVALDPLPSSRSAA